MVVLSARAVRRSGSVPVPACVGGCGVWESYSGCEHLVVRVVCAMSWGGAACGVGCVQGVRWMPGHQGPKKDVAVCDKPRGVGKRAVIRGCPNGGTWPGLCLVARV